MNNEEREAIIEDVAKTCHEINRTLCQRLGDSSQVPWVDAPGWQRKSAIEGVRNIADGKVQRPKDSHESWFKGKEADGWVYGKDKDATNKTHPCMVPFDELPCEQQLKDVLFFATSTHLLEAKGVEVPEEDAPTEEFEFPLPGGMKGSDLLRGALEGMTMTIGRAMVKQAMERQRDVVELAKRLEKDEA